MSAEAQFIRASRIARNTGFTLRTARKHVQAGEFGPPHFLWGEWCAPLEGYLAWLKQAKEPRQTA